MRLRIKHVTEYRYSSSVFLEPHQLRFKPKNTKFSQLEKFDLEVVPAPTGLSESYDAENNHHHLCWFSDLQDMMIINATSIVEVSAFSPFDFLVYPDEYLTLPFQYPTMLRSILEPALFSEHLDVTLVEYGKQIKDKVKDQTVDCILELTKQIFSDFKLEFRKTGPPHQANETFELKKGSCRDLAWMQIQLLRHFGIAARFVSGYYFLPMEEPDHELHAWVETYLPGAGWIGFDPSHGLAASASHIPVVSSAYFEKTMPVTGFVRGEVVSDLKTDVSIDILR